MGHFEQWPTLPDDVVALLAHRGARAARHRLGPLHQRVQVLWMWLRGGAIRTGTTGGGGPNLWRAYTSGEENIMSQCLEGKTSLKEIKSTFPNLGSVNSKSPRDFCPPPHFSCVPSLGGW